MRPEDLARLVRRRSQIRPEYAAGLPPPGSMDERRWFFVRLEVLAHRICDWYRADDCPIEEMDS
jgi:hypothetical protein